MEENNQWKNINKHITSTSIGNYGIIHENGIHAGPFQAYSFQEISDKNQELTTAINKANTANDNYTSALSKLKTDISNLTKAKKTI